MLIGIYTTYIQKNNNFRLVVCSPAYCLKEGEIKNAYRIYDVLLWKSYIFHELGRTLDIYTSGIVQVKMSKVFYKTDDTCIIIVTSC